MQSVTISLVIKKIVFLYQTIISKQEMFQELLFNTKHNFFNLNLTFTLR